MNEHRVLVQIQEHEGNVSFQTNELSGLDTLALISLFPEY